MKGRTRQTEAIIAAIMCIVQVNTKGTAPIVARNNQGVVDYVMQTDVVYCA